MGYRKLEKPKHHGHRTVQKTTTPATFYITNGEECRLAFPCWYKEVFPPMNVVPHCRDSHDHHGWPEPKHPDRSCQDHDFARFHHHGCHDATHTHGPASQHLLRKEGWYHFDHCGDYLDMNKLHPIHLTKEGYELVTIQVGEDIDGLAAKGWIDDKTDWVVRVWFKANVRDLEKPMHTKLAVRVHNDELNKTDTVFLGRLVVLPAAMHTLGEE